MDTGILLVDLGNSSLKWGWLSDAGLVDVDTLSHRELPLREQLQRCWSALARPGRVIIAAVARSQVKDELSKWVISNWGIRPVFLQTARDAAGVHCAYDDFSHLGIDRWAAIVAAYNLNRQAVCIVDCGTAVTIDAVDREGKHLGGFILPGLEMMRESLIKNTDIATFQQQEIQGFWGTDTGPAIESGIHKAIAGLVKQATHELSMVDDGKPGLVCTGGDALRIMESMDNDGEYRPDLVLEGIAILSGGV